MSKMPLIHQLLFAQHALNGAMAEMVEHGQFRTNEDGKRVKTDATSEAMRAALMLSGAAKALGLHVAKPRTGDDDAKADEEHKDKWA
jgi:hypothetical protein